MKKFLLSIVCAAAFSLPAATIFAHCQVPCGIYGDEARFDALEEHITTIEKGMNQITELSAAGSKNFNQIVRWVQNKDHHADELTEIVTYYFLAQRIKPDTDNYGKKLAALHQIMVSAMKAKQTTDLANVATLRELVSDFHELYFSHGDRAHLEEHHSRGATDTESVSADSQVKIQVVEAACGSCTYEMEGVTACVAAVKIDGKPYLVKGVDVDAHDLGLCKGALTAEVSGELAGTFFQAKAFKIRS